MISTKQLRYFDALARHGHFGRAAEHCAVTQPALSMQISQMEQALGLVLIERRSGGIALTAAGREVARRSADILARISGLSDFAVSCRTPLSTPVRLGAIPTIAPYLLPRLLPALRDRHPELALHIRETQTDTLIAELLSTTLDLAVIALPVNHAEMETLPLAVDRFLLAVPVAFPLLPEARVSQEMLGGLRVLLLEEGHCLRDQALGVCDLKSRNGADLLGASSLSTLVHMVASGFGVTLLPEISAGYESAHGGVRLIRFVDPEPTRMIGLAWRRSSPRKREFRMLGDLVREALGSPEAASFAAGEH